MLEDGSVSKAMQMSMISNQPLADEEYQRYVRHWARDKVPLISRRDVEIAKLQIKEAQT